MHCFFALHLSAYFTYGGNERRCRDLCCYLQSWYDFTPTAHNSQWQCNRTNLCQLTWMFLAAFDLALLVLWLKRSTVKNSASIPSAVISFVGALILCLLSYFEHLRTVRTSFLLNIYLLVTVVLDAARSRTYSLDKNLEVISVLFTTRVGVKLFLAIFEARSKKSLLLPDWSDYPPEATSGVYSRALFWWQNELFRKGFSNTLSVDDLFDLDKHLRSNYLQQRIQSAWDKCECGALSSGFSKRCC